MQKAITPRSVRFMRPLAVLLACLFLSGCQTEQPSDTKLVAHKVINTTAGMSGFRFDVPEGYSRVNPDSPLPGQEGMLKYYQDYASYAKDNPHSDYQESMLFSNGDSLIIFTLSRQRISKPFTQMTEFEKTNGLNRSMADWGTYWNTKIDMRETGKYADMQYGHIGFPLGDDFRAEEYMVLGALRETYQFFGIAPKSQENHLKLALNMMVMSLRY